MNNRILTLGLVVLIGVVIGVGVVNMTQKPQGAEPGDSMLGQQLGMIISSQSVISEKLSKIEEQQKSLLNILEEAKQAAMKMQQQVAQQRPQAPQPPGEDMNKAYDIPVGDSPVRGNKDAKITIVEFVDFQCPFCSRFYAFIPEIIKEYPNDVRFILKHFPLNFHPQAKPGAKAAMAAGEQGKYWEMVDALLGDNQDLSEDRFKAEAKKLGLDVNRFMKDYESKDAQWEDMINKDLTLAGTVDVRGTPTFYLNGKKTNARDLASFKIEIDQILKGQAK